MNTQKILVILSMLLIFCLVTACSPSDGTEPKTPAEQTSPESKAYTPLTASIVADLPETEDSEENSDLLDNDLLNKGKNIHNYQLFYSSKYRNNEGIFMEKESYTISVNNNLIKVVYTEHKDLNNEVNYDTLYLNLDAQTAYGICEKVSVVCESNKEKLFKLNFDENKTSITTPLSLLNRIGSGSDIKHLKGEILDNRKVMVIDFSNPDAELEELYIDNFYGIPLQQVIYGYNDDQKIVVVRNTFTIKDIGGVLNADVTPPNYPLVE